MSTKTLTLNIYKDDQLVETKSLTQDVVKIGKLKSSHLCLDDEGVARLHAVIETSGNDVRLIDLGSAQGTMLNGAAIDKNAALSSGDTVQVGPYRIEVSITDAVAAPVESTRGGTQIAMAAPAAAPVAAAAAVAAPAAAAAARRAPAPQIQVDLSSVEAQDGRQVAEVVAMLGKTPLDVVHVGQSRNRRATAPVFLLVGGAMVATGIGLFFTEVTQDWATWNKAALKAQQDGLSAPKVPGYNTGGLGLGLALLGLLPMVAGALRLTERVVEHYTIGEGHHATFHVPTAGLPDPVAFPLVRSGGGGFTLNFTKDMTGDVTVQGQRVALSELVSSGRAANAGSAYSFPLPPQASCRVKHGEVSFHINTVNPGLLMVGRGEMDWPVLAYVGGVGVVAGVFWFLITRIPQEYLLAAGFDESAGENRFVGFMNQPDEVKEEEPPPEDLNENSDEEAGGTGQRHAGEEGKMGKPTSKNKSGLYAMKGPKDAVPQMARNFDPDMKAREAGILGVMSSSSGHFLASPYGGAFAVGNDDADVWGGLTGTEIGEANGVGGLGLVGTGRGGGGTGEGTIGLGNTGLIGKGGGGGTGSGYGRGGGAGFGGKGTRVPTVRQAKADVQGALDKDIIRRIVRAHINEVRACYNQGLTRNPNMQGRVAVNFMITGTGKVGSAVVQEETIKDSEVANCIAKAVKRWTFPKPQGGGNVIVTYPFQLSPG